MTTPLELADALKRELSFALFSPEREGLLRDCEAALRQAAAPQGREALIEQCAKIAQFGAKECVDGDTEWHRGFRYAANNTALGIAEAIRALTPAVAPDAGRRPISFLEAMNIVERGFDTWKDKPHNARWYSRIDGTPIPNDLKVNIAEAICYSALAQAQEPGLTEEQMQGAMTQAQEATSRVAADAYVDPASKRVPMGQAQKPGEDKR